MDPCRRRACEALVECLANPLANGHRDISLPRRSELQDTLHVPPQLIYIAALVVGDSHPPFTPAQQAQFTSLQKLYELQLLTTARSDSDLLLQQQTTSTDASNDGVGGVSSSSSSDDDEEDGPSPPPSPNSNKNKHNNNNKRSFALSPTLKPNEDDRQRIEREVQDMMVHLETQAQLAEEELRVLAEAETTKTSNITTPKQRQRQQRKPPQKINISTAAKQQLQYHREESMTPRTCETLEQVLAQIQPQQFVEDACVNSSTLQSGVLSAGEWTTVRSNNKNNKRTPKNTAMKQPSPNKPKQRVSFAAGDCFVLCEAENQQPFAKAAPTPETVVKTKTDQGEETVVNIRQEDDEASLVEEPKVEVTLIEETKEEPKREKPRLVRQQRGGTEETKLDDAELEMEEEEEDDEGQPEHQQKVVTTKEEALVQTEVVPISLSDVSAMSEEGLNNNQTTTAANPEDHIQNLMDQLQDRVRQLEVALTKSKELCEKQRVEHARELFKEREQAEERQQALQLRLYISETKLKTYEDALAEHIKAVANNTAGSPDRHDASSQQGKRPWECTTVEGKSSPAASTHQ